MFTLPPKAKKLYSMAAQLKGNFQNIKNKERLISAMALAESPIFSKAKVNKKIFEFFVLPNKNAAKKSRGRRYSFEDKVFATTRKFLWIDEKL